MSSDNTLWRYFQEIRNAVEAANRGEGNHPYVKGTFIVSALADEIELSISDISEEDAVLIASELREQGVKAVVRASVVCTHCGERVPDQDFCVSCRGRLEPPPTPDLPPGT